MKKILLALVFVLLAFSSVHAQDFVVKNIPSAMTAIQSSDKGSGRDLWSNVIKTVRMQYKGSPILYLEEKGQGIYGSDKTYKTWTSRSYFGINGTKVTPQEISIVYKDKSGKTVHTIQRFYDAVKNKIVCTSDREVKTFDMASDIVDKNNISIALANYPYDSPRDLIFNFMTNEPAVYKMTAKFQGQEPVIVAGSAVNCYKLRLIPDLGAANIFGAFVPSIYFWVDVSAPHRFIKYEGLESGLGTPYIVMLVKE